MTLRCTVVHACPEYLRGDRLNYFRVPLGVNDRTIDNKSARQFRRSSSLEFLFFHAPIRGRIATTAGKIGWFETATRVGVKTDEFGRTRGIETIRRSVLPASRFWESEFAAHERCEIESEATRYRFWFNLCVNSCTFSAQFVLFCISIISCIFRKDTIII